MGQDLVSGPRGLVVKIQYSHCSGLTSVSGLETKVLLQAAAGWGHPRSLWIILSGIKHIHIIV